MLSITGTAAVHPKKTIAASVLFCIAIFLVGAASNFVLEVEQNTLWTPIGSYADNHDKWLEDESGFPDLPRRFVMIFHQNGEQGVLRAEPVRRVFQALDAIRNVDGYRNVCSREGFFAADDCPITGVTKFWNNSAALFESEIGNDDEAALNALSARTYPDDGTPVSDHEIFGNPVRDNETGLLSGAQTLVLVILLPRDDEDADETLSLDFEEFAIDAIQALGDAWEVEPNNPIRVEAIAERSLNDEFARAVLSDIP